MTISVPVEPIRAASQPLANTLPSALQAARQQGVLLPLANLPMALWRDLHSRAVEPNAYYHPLWAGSVSEHARGRTGALALVGFDGKRLAGFMPVRWSRQALSLPGPMLVGWNAYAPLAVPTLDREQPVRAAGELIKAARAAGAHALLLPGTATEGPAFAALKQALAERRLSPRVLRSYRRAALDATSDAESLLRDALGAKKLKELRRQRNRLEDSGALTFSVATEPDDVAVALEAFLRLEASGWKGERGTALMQHPGDAAFIRQSAPALAAERRFEIASLTRNGQTLASGLILRDGPTAYFFKIAMDESEARCSPGVQLTLDLTRHFCADPQIQLVDSSTDFVHPMIDHVWRKRIEIADVFIALRRRDAIAQVLRLAVEARYRAIDLVRAIRRIREKVS